MARERGPGFISLLLSVVCCPKLVGRASMVWESPGRDSVWHPPQRERQSALSRRERMRGERACALVFSATNYDHSR